MIALSKFTEYHFPNLLLSSVMFHAIPVIFEIHLPIFLIFFVKLESKKEKNYISFTQQKI